MGGSMKRVLLAVGLLALLPACALHIQGISAGFMHGSKADPDPPKPAMIAPVVVQPSTVAFALAKILRCQGKSDEEVIDALREAGIGPEASLYVLIARDSPCRTQEGVR